MKAPKDKDVVVITGGSGMLGTAVTEALGKRGRDDAEGISERRQDVPQIVGFDVVPQPKPLRYSEYIIQDVTDPGSIERGLERIAWQYGRRIAAFVDLAAFYDFSGKDDSRYDKVTVEGTRSLIKALHAQRFEVERFIFSSTMLVHQPGEPGRPIDESSPLAPGWPYPESKLKTEELLHEEHGDYPVTNLRIAGVYTDRCGSIPISHQIKRIRERTLKSHFYAADPKIGQAFVHKDDTAAAIIAAIDRRDEQPEEASYLIGEPETYAYGALQNRLGELLHGEEEWRTLEMPAPLAKAGAAVQDTASSLPGVPDPFIKPWMIDHAGDHYELDIFAARRDLGWSPEHRLIDTLPAMVEALKEDPKAWYEEHQLGKPG